MIFVRDVIEAAKGLIPGFFGEEEGLRFGNQDNRISGIMVCWMATLEAIKTAYKKKANLIITHESLFYPYEVELKGNAPDFLIWQVNRNRIEFLAKYGINLIRLHRTLDRICIFDDFAGLLGLPKPSIVEDNLVKIYDINSVTFGKLIEKVKRCTGLKVLRVTPGKESRVIKRIGLPWGGLGLMANVGYMQSLVFHNCDAFIAGETDNYGFNFAIDSGIEMIETSHEVSENPGLKHFSDMLKEKFHGVPVIFFENKIPWKLK